MKRIIIIIGAVLGLLLAGVGGYVYYLYSSTKSAVNEMQETVKIDQPKPELTGEKKRPISILLLGVDERKGDKGRSDTMILITVNPKQESMLMFNIPRDTRMEIVGKGIEDKVNHAYAFGGTQMAMDTVENFLDVKVDYYMKVNMESFRDIVDAVGGVTVNNPFAFKYGGHTFPEGEQHLDGKQALEYSRMRYEDPKGDRGRNDRQRQVISAIINKGASASSITKFDNILEILGDNVKTNMTFDEMKDIQKNYKDARKKVDSTEIIGSGQTINKVWYYIINDEEKARLQTMVAEHLKN
ncbi:LCP family protein [Fictibacillus aquaticus]|uniref:Polyisoprenyl-teichoic acid--peptidoglycan teichoic acid transferase TagU n=1 Tax=Fictibacillus aquaticus TaxID=2021314 RepID=A0A235FA41_9BACL|nr:LCP family protein [Fictibacillus aquaticus]OYD57595.1 LytR family transcriptional regulator [Fictibacillus aquaticus]